MSRQFYITDVFSEGPYAGNQLATISEADGLGTDEMQKIARAFNFAETTFITGGSLELGFDVRIFTPNTELPFAGHPTLGTSYLVRDKILNTRVSETVSEIVLNLGVGPIPVSFGADGVLWMQQNKPAFGQCLDRAVVADELGLAESDVHQSLPCQFVSTGLEFLLVPLTSYEALKASCVQTGKLAQGIFVFCLGGYSPQQQIKARMYASNLGVTEDPATGSANGCLAAYLAHHAYFGSHQIDICVGQGYEIDRPSQLYLRSEESATDFRVSVGGRVNLVAEGQWHI